MLPACLVDGDVSNVTVRDRRGCPYRACYGASLTVSCATCTRSFQFLARTQPDAERDALGVQCWFEDAEDADHSEQAHDLPNQPTLASTAASQGQKRKATGEVEADPGRTIYDLEMKVGE